MTFFLTVFLMFFARSAYKSVFRDSSKCCEAGDMCAIITVIELPPRESFSNLVSLESLFEVE